MSDNSFSLLLAGKVAQSVNLLMTRYGWDEDYALKRFVESRLYSYLEDEKSKVWHYSPSMLAQLFDDERAGQLILPEV